MICYFWEGLKPSIKIELEQQDRKFMDFEEMVQKAVNVEAKAGLRSSTMVQKSDARCARGHRPSHNTSLKIQTQGTTAKKTRTEESRPKKAKLTDGKVPALPRSNEPAKPNYKKKKREWFKKKKNSTPAIGDNVIEDQKKKQTPGNIS